MNLIRKPFNANIYNKKNLMRNEKIHALMKWLVFEKILLMLKWFKENYTQLVLFLVREGMSGDRSVSQIEAELTIHAFPEQEKNYLSFKNRFNSKK